jgi:hypothetical protein
VGVPRDPTTTGCGGWAVVLLVLVAFQNASFSLFLPRVHGLWLKSFSSSFGLCPCCFSSGVCPLDWETSCLPSDLSDVTLQDDGGGFDLGLFWVRVLDHLIQRLSETLFFRGALLWRQGQQVFHFLRQCVAEVLEAVP